MPSFGNIYSATLGSSQLESDNEHTLLTTDASTTHIIKDVKLSNNGGVGFSAGNGTYLELNGHKVGSLSDSGLSGELIVPPNSTLKLFNHSFPVAFQYQKEWFMESGSLPLRLKRSVVDIASGNVMGTVSEQVSDPSYTVTNGTQIIDVTTREARDSDLVNHLFYYSHDDNSVQQIYTIGLGPGKSTSAATSIRYENYKAFGFTPDRIYDTTRENKNQFYSLDNNRFEEYYSISGTHDSTTAGVISSGKYSRTTTGGGNVGVMPTSSYPRGSFSLRATVGSDAAYWAFWVPSSGYTTDIYGFQNDGSGSTKRFNFRFRLPTGWSASTRSSFCISVDPVSDKFIIWRVIGDSSVYRHECEISWSTFQTGYTTSPNLKTIESNQFDYQTISLQSPMVNSMAARTLSNRMDGGFAHKGSDNCLYHYNSDGEFLFKQSAYETASGSTIASTQNTVPWAFNSQAADASVLTELGITQPTFDININGYTS